MQQHPPNCDCRHWQRSPGVSKSPQLRARETALNAVLEVVHHSASALGQKEECFPWPSAAPGVAMFHLTPFTHLKKQRLIHRNLHSQQSSRGEVLGAYGGDSGSLHTRILFWHSPRSLGPWDIRGHAKCKLFRRSFGPNPKVVPIPCGFFYHVQPYVSFSHFLGPGPLTNQCRDIWFQGKAG